MNGAVLTVMGFDYGTRRIGVAVGQTLTRTASPLRSVPVHARRPDWDRITAWVSEYQPQKFIVGLPLSHDERPHPLTDQVKRFSRQLTDRFRLPVEFIDERLSSHEAVGAAADIDAEAARIILESWLREHDARSPASSAHT
ncbi:MAG TPA: Holliday junction resolvase RuvX [Gammaproteobacteria bacterium]|nr:Holliday junction resolvase RuvX [Gammaproteobacteria bacterium]